MMRCANLFALHYFLWFSALTSIYGYISVYANTYANTTNAQYGLLNMILPFVTILTKLFFCSLADRHQAYRFFFVVFLITALLGYGSFAILPFFVKLPLEPGKLVLESWIAICIMTSVSTISMSVISCLSDAFAMNYSKKNNISYGQIRVWGTIGWGLSSFALAFINQIPQLPKLVPGLIMLIVLLVIDIAAVLSWRNKSDFQLDKSNVEVDLEQVISSITRTKGIDRGSSTKLSQLAITNNYGAAQPSSINADDADKKAQDKISSLSTQWLLFKEVARLRKSIFRYLLLFTISGALISLQWSYFFVFLEKIYPDDFAFISGLSMVGQSMIGELPFFLLSERIVKLLGRSHTLSLSIIAIGVRYFLYEYLLTNASMYFVLLTEALQGPCFGLFYVVMTEVGLDYSDCESAIVKAVESGVTTDDPRHYHKLRQALRATMQSLMSASYEGLGLGIGSIVGGVVIDSYGFDQLWFWAAIVALALGLTNILLEMANISILVDDRTILRTQVPNNRPQ